MLPYLLLSYFAQRRTRTMAKWQCKNLNIKLVFSSFKIKYLINVKDSVPRLLRSNVVYMFTYAESKCAYAVKTSQHLSIRVRKHLFTDKNLTSLENSGVPINIKSLVMTVVSQIWTQVIFTIT